jgi:hypothetical protein
MSTPLVWSSGNFWPIKYPTKDSHKPKSLALSALETIKLKLINNSKGRTTKNWPLNLFTTRQNLPQQGTQ